MPFLEREGKEQRELRCTKQTFSQDELKGKMKMSILRKATHLNYSIQIKVAIIKILFLAQALIWEWHVYARKFNYFRKSK